MMRFILDTAPSAAEATGKNAEMAQSVGGVLTIAALGLLVVFAVLVLLMCVIKLMGALVKEKPKKEAAAEPSAPAVTTDQAVPAAPGSCGEVKLFDVPDKTAAMLMAITADKLGEPLNTLRFISIKEVK